MTRVMFKAAALVSFAALSGCANLDAALRPGGLGEKVLTNLEACHREYSGAIGAGVTGAFRIVCDPAPTGAAPPPKP